MQKVILDTNVIVSALISSSYPSKILYHLALTGKVDICLSEQVYLEYVDVLRRKKFLKFNDFLINADIVLKRLNEVSFFFQPTTKIDVLSDDGDNKFLELALVSNADFLITGNTNHFDFAEFGITRIVNPKDYWEEFAP